MMDFFRKGIIGADRLGHCIDDLDGGWQNAEWCGVALPGQRHLAQAARVIGSENDHELSFLNRHGCPAPSRRVDWSAALIIDMWANHPAEIAIPRLTIGRRRRLVASKLGDQLRWIAGIDPVHQGRRSLSRRTVLLERLLLHCLKAR